MTAPTGGALSWAGGVRAPDGAITWYDRHGEAVCHEGPTGEVTHLGPWAADHDDCPRGA